MKKQYLYIILILAIGIAIAAAIIKTAPQPQKKVAAEVPPLVEVDAFMPAQQAPYWQGGATVNANDSVNLIAQVAGQLEWVNPDIHPGQFVKQGTVLARVEQADYQLQLEQKKAALVQAQSNLDIEFGQVENARSDYRLSGVELKPAAKALALRQPQLASAKASLKMAQADLDKAKLDLKRTKIVMPFDGHILQQLAFTGSYLTSAMPVFNVIDSTLFWTEVSVPSRFLRIMDEQAEAEIGLLNSGASRSAQVLSVSPAVNANDRQARVLLGISHPLTEAQEKPIIRYNDYIRVTLFAKASDNLYRIPSDKVDAGQLWAVNDKNQLNQVEFELVFKGREYSWVKFDTSTIANNRLLISEISGKEEGLLVRVKTQAGAQ